MIDHLMKNKACGTYIHDLIFAKRHTQKYVSVGVDARFLYA